MSKSKAARQEDNSDEELIIKKQVKHVTFLGLGDLDVKTGSSQTNKQKSQQVGCTTEQIDKIKQNNYNDIGDNCKSAKQIYK